MRRTVKTVLAAALVLAASCACGARGQAAAAGERMSFSEDTPVQHPVALRPDVLRALFETQEARQVLNFASDAAQDDPARLFRAAEVHLAGPEETDLVVIGVPPMSGADAGWFWIVRETRNGPRVVLFTGANTLELAGSATNGYRDILTTWSSAAETQETTFHFDGKIYRGFEKRTRDRK